MENQEYVIVHVSMSLMIKPGSFKYLRPSIEEGMEFDENEGILSLDYKIESEDEEE